MCATDLRFEIILYAGNAESSALMAMDSARENDFEEAEKQLKNGLDQLHKAHQIQTNLLQNESRGQKTEIDILMVHAQDHLTMGSVLMNVAKEIIELNKRLSKLEEK